MALEIEIGSVKYNLIDGLFYSKNHQWVKIEGEIVKIGISDFAQAQLGEISLIELTLLSKGAKITQNEIIPDISIESAKTVADIYAPLSGIITDVNYSAAEVPENINGHPYDIWLFQVRPSNISLEKHNLMDIQAYADFLKKL
jgi:glycine cleavage system H protein